MTAKKLTERQWTALRLVGSGFVSSFTEASCPALVRRGLVEDHGRYWDTRGHPGRYGITDAGRTAVTNRFSQTTLTDSLLPVVEEATT